MSIRSLGEDAYFVASNSASGFYSYYRECFDAARVRHVYAVKGGPGTGKSRFLREVAQSAEQKGWDCEYIYCSSDPDSLDGVILSQNDACIALLDATAPHVYEPKLPGVREDIVNLGEFWNIEMLTAHHEAITALQGQKGDAYRRAYRYLAGVGEMTKVRDSLVFPYLRLSGIRHLAERLMQDIPIGVGYQIQPALVRSVGMRGKVGLDTYFARAKRIYRLEDCRGSARYLLDAIGELAVEKKLRIRVSYDPVLPEHPDGIFLCESETAFVIASEKECSYPHRQVRLRRFVEISKMKDLRAQINYAERMKRAMLSGAIEALAEVRDAHFRLEQIYMSAMDFTAKENFTKQFCNRIFT